jgi:hypothetical protein
MLKKEVLFSVFVLIGFAGVTYGSFWNGSTGDGLWKTPGNWDSVPAINDDALFYYAPGQDVVIDSGTDAFCAQLNGLGWAGSAEGSLTIQSGGSLTSNTGIILGQLGPSRMHLDGGTVNADGNGQYVYVGHDYPGTLVMSSGLFSVTTLYVSLSGGQGHIQLDGGLLSVSNWMDLRTNGTMDITNGKMVVTWVGSESTWMSDTYQPLIDAGKITGFGDPANVRIGYEEGLGATLYAVPEPVTIALLGLGGLGLLRGRKTR